MATMVAKSSLAFIVSNPRLFDNPIIICNDAFTKMTGYSRDEVIGRNCRFLRGQDTQPEATEKLRNGIFNNENLLVEILNYKRDGSSFRNAVMIAPMFDDDGELAYFLGSQMELPRKTARAQPTRRLMAIRTINLLSQRQKSVLVEVAKGLKNKQIAHVLQISQSTVKMHRSNILSKLGVSTTAEAIRLAVEARL